MPYSLQSFAFNQVLTAAQMNQTEANIRDHTHGVGGVAATGLAFSYGTPITGGQTIQASDAGKHFLCDGPPLTSGAYVLDFETVGTLGAGWAATFTNVGSTMGFLLDPNTSEKINTHSEFYVGIGETVTVHCDGSELFTYGQRDLVHLATYVGSTGDIGSSNVAISYYSAWDTFDFVDLRGQFQMVSTRAGASEQLLIDQTPISGTSPYMSFAANDLMLFWGGGPAFGVHRISSISSADDPTWQITASIDQDRSINLYRGNWGQDGAGDLLSIGTQGFSTESNLKGFYLEVWARRIGRRTGTDYAPTLTI